jgi:ABC-type sugar transport system substrate-binding protein
MFKQVKRHGLAVLAVVSSGLLAGVCSAATTPDSTSPASDVKGTIGVTLPTAEGAFYSAMLYGITKAAKDAGYGVIILSAGGFGNIDKQVNQMQNLISRKVAIMLVNPADPTATEGPIKQAIGQGITVIGAGAPEPGSQGYSASSHCDIGKALAVGARKLLPKGGTIGIVAGPPGAFWSTERLRCFKIDIKDSGIKIVAEKTEDATVVAGLNVASDMLQRFPDLSLFYGADDTVGVGAAQAVQAGGLCGKTQVLTAVYGEQTQQLMAKGCIQYVVGLQPVLIGTEAVRLGVALHNGQKPDANEVFVPFAAITPSTMKDVDISSIRAPSGWKPPL